MRLKFPVFFLTCASSWLFFAQGCSFDQLNITKSKSVAPQISLSQLKPVTTAQISTGSGDRVRYQYPEVNYLVKAEEIATLLSQGKFEEIEIQLADFVDRKLATTGGFYYPDTIIRSAFTDEILTEKTFKQLNRWNETRSGQLMPLLMRAQFYYQLSSQIRDKSPQRRVPKHRFQEYVQLISLSAEDIAAAKKIDPTHPLVSLAILNVSKEIKLPQEEFDYHVENFSSQIPFAPQPYQAQGLYLLWKNPRGQKALAYSRYAAAMSPRGSAIPILISHIHRFLASNAKSNQSYFGRPDVWADIEGSFPRLVEDFPEVGLYAAWYAELASYAGKDNVAQKYMKIALEREPNHSEILDIKRKNRL